MSVVRVLIVDDSEMACDMLSNLFSNAPDFDVIAVAHNGQEAVDRAAELKPDLITMDLRMPVMDGYEAVERIMAYHPAPILVITSYNEAETAFRCVSLGALDVMDKPDIDDLNDEMYVRRFLSNARLLASTPVIAHPARRLRDKKQGIQPPQAAPPSPAVTGAADSSATASRLVAIAASTGGPQALVALFSHIPAGATAAFVVVQHIAAGFEDGLLAWLDSSTPLTVSLADDGTLLRPGHVFLAPPDVHIIVDEDCRIGHVHAEPVAGHRPSAKFLFESAAAAYADCCAGVILTGMGSDGAEALGHVKMAGGLALAQDESSSTIYGMPRVAVEYGSVTEVLPLPDIAPRLLRWLGP